MPDPEYPEAARRQYYGGTVVLAIVVDKNGRVIEAKVTRSLGIGLDEAAAKAVRKWEFKPALLADGTSVPVQISVEVSFHNWRR